MNESINKNHKSGLWVFVLLFGAYLVGNITISMFIYEEFALYHQLVDVLIPCLLYLVVTKQPVISTLKLNVGLSVKNIWRIFQLFLASFLVKYGINYLVDVVVKVDSGEVTMQVLDMVPDMWIFFISVAVIPVILEEVFLRGVVLDHFRDVTLLQASIVTGILFGIIHIDLGQLGYATALGIVMGAIVMVTGSLWAGILFHFLNNFLSFAVLASLKKAEEMFPELYDVEQILQGQSVDLTPKDEVYMIITAVVVLIIGGLLSVRYVKKMIKENDFKDVDSQVSWFKLFFNVPMGIILLVYLGMNLFLW
ncbi:CPBP family intramembrane glutamic endopeptidase [Alkalibacter mobilis]|uniref:CPBP family intramembrane glutamic endopeptidase n=1 Tax=Alkalibacter mobilis TaxID=2787712 RepID=UPI00189F4E5F|nr:type II CAAX endopeptidase family protein [Alkalibacter mobilis]MBF7097652.1 CPBP family intramembrane metalloprotease [Alkalibacter mobilis]